MRPIVTFTVANNLPTRINRLHDLYRNLYWTWHPEIREAIRAVDPDRWHRANHHPVAMLGGSSNEDLERLAEDPDFLRRYDAAIAELDRYKAGSGWYHRVRSEEHRDGETIAYLSAEYGLHESIPLYSGGLGVLSGDHTKSASDLALPVVCVGLLYQMGYFHQRLAVDGTQRESYDLNNPTSLLLNEVVDATGQPIRITVDYPLAPVTAKVWRLDVGRIPLYLLDTNIAENTIPEYRDIADHLYGGDQELRIMQEVMLGIGGLRALQAIGVNPTVTHSNEGHSAFLMLERTRQYMANLGLTFAEAAELTSAGSIFTTHTPVPAGNDSFPPELIEKYFSDYREQLGLSLEEFLALGRVDAGNPAENFSMTVLALRMASRRNGVSQLHGEVSRTMWKDLWKSIPHADTPIIGITNGVHTKSWIADPIRTLIDQRLGEDWDEAISSPESWKRVAEIPDDEFWRIKNHLRADLVHYIHKRLDEQRAEWFSRSTAAREIARILDPGILTIGFARRFATYKRATLLFRDRDRAYRLFTDPDRPVQLVMAGKAHPQDIRGKEFIQQVIAFIRDTGLESRIVFVEDYDLGVARKMTSGCDVWLNTPRRLLEASGTSGMKAAINGTLNLSILDGWYPEAFDGTNGFAIGTGEELADDELRDEYESRRLYRVLEDEVIPAFYERNDDDVPTKWLTMQKRAMMTIVPRFSSDRMVEEYATRFYFPCSDRFRKLYQNHAAGARLLVSWKERVRRAWNSVRIVKATVHARSVMKVDQAVNVLVEIDPGSLDPLELRLEAYCGELDPAGLVSNGTPARLELVNQGNGTATYVGSVTLTQAGQGGVAVRVFPWNDALVDVAEADLMTWA